MRRLVNTTEEKRVLGACARSQAALAGSQNNCLSPAPWAGPNHALPCHRAIALARGEARFASHETPKCDTWRRSSEGAHADPFVRCVRSGLSVACPLSQGWGSPSLTSRRRRTSATPCPRGCTAGRSPSWVRAPEIPRISPKIETPRERAWCSLYVAFPLSARTRAAGIPRWATTLAPVAGSALAREFGWHAPFLVLAVRHLRHLRSSPLLPALSLVPVPGLPWRSLACSEYPHARERESVAVSPWCTPVARSSQRITTEELSPDSRAGCGVVLGCRCALCGRSVARRRRRRLRSLRLRRRRRGLQGSPGAAPLDAQQRRPAQGRRRRGGYLPVASGRCPREEGGWRRVRHPGCTGWGDGEGAGRHGVERGRRRSGSVGSVGTCGQQGRIRGRWVRGRVFWIQGVRCGRTTHHVRAQRIREGTRRRRRAVRGPHSVLKARLNAETAEAAPFFASLWGFFCLAQP